MHRRRRASLALISSLSLWACDARDQAHESAKLADVLQRGIGDPGSAELAGARASAPSLPKPDTFKLQARSMREFGVLPPDAPSADNPSSTEKIDLGRALFFDPRLSKNHDVSCNTCHLLDHYGVDGTPTSTGHKGQLGERNSPSVYNAAFQLSQFWDGRAATVEEQARAPIVNPVEMARADEASTVEVLRSIPGYVDMFQKAFPEHRNPVTFDNLALAIASFERRLTTQGPFDEFVAGDPSALDEKAQQGLALFFEAECTKCHTGPLLGGTMYQKLGSVKDYPTKDEGRAAITGNEREVGFFKVPPLRNVAETAPYLHDGSVETLEEMVQIMADVQSSKGRFAPHELEAMMAFLAALTGPIPTGYVEPPELPPSGPDTPPPDPS